MVKRKLKKIDVDKLVTPLVIILLLLVVLNLILGFNLGGIFKDIKTIEPAKISVFSINVDCDKCLDISKVVSSISSNNVEILEEKNLDVNDDEAKELINKYNIEKLPSLVVIGEIENINTNQLTKIEDALVLTNLNPPYFDVKKNKVVGIVDVTSIVDSKCEDCFDLDLVVKQLEQLGIEIGETKELEYSEAQDLVKKYKIEKIPSLLLSEDASVYTNLVQLWSRVGSEEDDGVFVYREVNPPYLELKTGKVRGLVSLTLLKDDSCDSCYDVNLHKKILTNFGIKVVSEKTLDISSSNGKTLVEKYKIINVPTLILSKEAGDYEALASVWDQVGSVESDGSYIFRKTEVMGTYKNLDTGDIVLVSTNSQ